MSTIMTYREALREALQEAMEGNKHETKISDIINKPVTFAENGRLEPMEDLEKFVYSLEVVQ